MPISSLAFVLTGLLSTSAAPVPEAAARKSTSTCQTAEPKRVRTMAENRPHTLQEEPSGRATYTVLHTENGCSRPVHIGDEVQRKDR